MEICPAFGGHELAPTTIEAAMVALADFEVAGPGVELWVEAFVAQAHLQIQRVASGYRPPAGLLGDLNSLFQGQPVAIGDFDNPSTSPPPINSVTM